MKALRQSNAKENNIIFLKKNNTKKQKVAQKKVYHFVI